MNKDDIMKIDNLREQYAQQMFSFKAINLYDGEYKILKSVVRKKTFS